MQTQISRDVHVATPIFSPIVGKYDSCKSTSRTLEIGAWKLKLMSIITACMICWQFYKGLTIVNYDSRTFLWHPSSSNLSDPWLGSNIVNIYCKYIFLFFKMGLSRPLFSLFSSFQYTVDSKQMFNKLCRWLDSNRGPLVLKATALPTEPHNHCPEQL